VATYDDYARAAALLWGPAGEFAADEFARINREHFGGSVPPLPIVIGIAAYGHCVGLTRGAWTAGPRISLAAEIFNGSAREPGGTLQVSDVLVHEMVHAALIVRGEERRHNFAPWCRMIAGLSPAVLGREVDARPVGLVRIPNPDRETDPAAPKTKPARRAAEGALTQKQLARWPVSLRPAGYYAAGQRLQVPAY
jgi:hypothetical protein